MTIAFGSIGARSGGGTTTVSVALPAGAAAGDMLVAGRCVFTDISATASNEAGWTPGGDLHGGTGASNDSHTTRVRIDYKEATGSDTDPTVFDQAGTISGAVGQCARYTKTEAAWDTAATATGTDDTHAGGRSVTASSAIDFQPGDMLVVAVAYDTDQFAASPTYTLTASGITFGATTKRSPDTAGVTTGQDGNIMIADALVTAGSGTVAPVLTITQVTPQCGPVSFLRLREDASAAPAEAEADYPIEVAFAAETARASEDEVDYPVEVAFAAETARASEDEADFPVEVAFAAETARASEAQADYPVELAFAATTSQPVIEAAEAQADYPIELAFAATTSQPVIEAAEAAADFPVEIIFAARTRDPDRPPIESPLLAALGEHDRSLVAAVAFDRVLVAQSSPDPLPAFLAVGDHDPLLVASVEHDRTLVASGSHPT